MLRLIRLDLLPRRDLMERLEPQAGGDLQINRSSPCLGITWVNGAAVGPELGATTADKGLPCGTVQTVKTFACTKPLSQLVMRASPVSTGPVA